MTPETEEIIATVGPRHKRRDVPGVRFGIWAATNIETGWSVTHTPTGLGVGGCKMERAAAVELARRLADALPTYGADRKFCDVTTQGTAEDSAVIRQVIDEAQLAASWVRRLAAPVSEALLDLANRGDDVSIALTDGRLVITVGEERFESTSIVEALADARRARDAKPAPPEVEEAAS